MKDKRRERRDKKAVKRAGQRHARRELARRLRENPDEAAFDEVDFGRWSTEAWHVDGSQDERTSSRT